MSSFRYQWVLDIVSSNMKVLSKQQEVFINLYNIIEKCMEYEVKERKQVKANVIIEPNGSKQEVMIIIQKSIQEFELFKVGQV